MIDILLLQGSTLHESRGLAYLASLVPRTGLAPQQVLSGHILNESINQMPFAKSRVVLAKMPVPIAQPLRGIPFQGMSLSLP